MSVELVNAELEVCQFGTVGGYNICFWQHPDTILVRTASYCICKTQTCPPGRGTAELRICFFVFVKMFFGPACTAARLRSKGGGFSTASRPIRDGGYGAGANTLSAMDMAAEFDRAGASFRRRLKPASCDLNLLSFGTPSG